MKVFITHQSALEYWRLHGGEAGAARRPYLGAVPADPPNRTGLALPGLDGLTLPLDVTVRTSVARRTSQAVRPHVLGCLPRGGAISVGGWLLIASPELCFLQMAGKLSRVGLIQLAMELCGGYSLPNQQNAAAMADAPGFYDRAPLSTTGKLTEFVQRVSILDGRGRALKALGHFADGASSPMETVLFLLLTLPRRLGGHGLPQPELNARIDLPQPSATGSPSHYRCDLYWPVARLAVEYDSDMFHANATRMAADSRRRTALAALGVSVFSVTNQELRSMADTASLARLLASRLGVRLQSLQEPRFLAAQRELRRQLLTA